MACPGSVVLDRSVRLGRRPTGQGGPDASSPRHRGRRRAAGQHGPAAPEQRGGAPGVRSVYKKLNKIQRRILSGFATSELNPATTSAPVRPRSARQARPGDIYFPTDSLGCPDRRGSNVKVNRNCLDLADVDLTGRSQANNETSVAIDPRTGNLVVGDNDDRRGDSGCVAGYSRNGGRIWSDSEVPTGFTRGDAFGAAPRVLAGGPATRRSPSTPAATPTTPASSSTGASRPPR